MGDIVSSEKLMSLEQSCRHSAEQDTPCMTHVRGIVYGGPAVIPFHNAAISRDELCLCGRKRCLISVNQTHTLLLVRELYTFKTGSTA